MFDTLSVARELTDAGLSRDQAHAIAEAVRKAAEHGDHVTPDQFRAGLAELETRLVQWMIGTVLAGIAGAAAVTAAIIRLLGQG